jgi:CRISPR-associated protein Cmr2
MNQHLILISIGPVQSFIAQARKLRDLRSGSQLLTELTKAAITAFEALGGKVIVPGNPESDSLPNRMLGRLGARSIQEACDIAQELEGAVHQNWEQIIDQVKKSAHFPKNGGAADWEARFDEQTAQQLEVYWAVEPYDGSMDYPRAYKSIEARLGSAKNVRTFEQIGARFGGEESSRKDALTGERDALVFGHIPAKADVQDSRFPATTTQGLPRRLPDCGALVGPNEGLSATSFIKRVRKLENQAFFATADVALLSVRNKLATHSAAAVEGAGSYEKFTGLHDIFNSYGDGQLAYQENLNDDYFRKQGLPISELSSYQIAHEKLRKSLKVAGLKQTSYYAVLAFDGDNMGEWLSGQKLPSDRKLTHLLKFHTTVGEVLAEFSKKAKRIVDESGHGLTVYAGGDDYLGLITLDSLFLVLEQLRVEFTNTVSAPLQKKFGIKDEFTFSAGVVVAHYKRPLGDTVSLAHKAEKAAKNYGRDALCIRIVKRSGEQQEACFKWQLSGTVSESLANLRGLVSLLQGQYGRTWLTESARIITQLFGTGEVDKTRQQLLNAELSRLLRRTISFGADAGAEQGNKSQVATEYLRKLTLMLTEGQSNGAERLVHTLQIIDFCKREMNTLSLQTEPATL